MSCVEMSYIIKTKLSGTNKNKELLLTHLHIVQIFNVGPNQEEIIIAGWF